MIRERATELLDFVQLLDRADDKVEPLSGGMKRRLTIARSLINSPDVLLLDEPTTGLDPQARHVVWDRLFRLKQQGVSLVLTTHYMDEAEQLCDRLVVMDKGKIAASGSPRELINEYSTRDVVEVRFALGENEIRRDKLAGLADRDRSAARPRTALHRRRRRMHRCRAAIAASGRCRRWFGAARSKTSSCGSPAARWLTEMTTTRFTATPALRSYRYWVAQYRRTWRGSVSTTVVSPVLYLTAMGIGLGSLVHRSSAIGGVTYLQFIGPGLLAATAMQIAAGESTYPRTWRRSSGCACITRWPRRR